MKVCPKCGGSGKVQDDKILGAEMRTARETANKGLREISRVMGISAAYLCDLEYGRRTWSTDLQNSFRKALEAV